MTTRPAWTAVEAALDAILALPEHEWAAAAERVGGADPRMRAELASLLAHVGGFDPVLDRPAATALTDGVAPVGSLTAGTRIGAYRILHLLGRGGMGEVYVAERADGLFESQVALKLVTREAAARPAQFALERQVLARLTHPGIARLLDAGIAADGRPYLVMELIDGLPLLDWCRTCRCDLRRRVDLFLQICDSVGHAHRHLIVHRDLKPANVLVTTDGTVKLLDFGIAKLLSSDARETTQSIPLTPGYAAPEQLSTGDVTTATDVYALGLLLFELLTGDRPWRIGDLPLAVGIDKTLHEAPPLPSERAAREDDPPVPPALLRGDLDAIVAKCLRKEPQHRYDSVAALQADLARWRRAEPVEARDHARLYVLGRFLRRHRTAVLIAACALLLVLTAVGAVLVQARHASRAAARANAIRQFLVSVFSASDPRKISAKPRGEITARELLDANAGRIPREFADDPVTEIELLRTVASIYRELGESSRFVALHAQMLALARSTYGPDDPRVLDYEMDDAQYAIDHEDFASAGVLLGSIDPTIHHAGLDGTGLRARWYLLRGESLSAASTAQGERLRALQNATSLYRSVAPIDRHYVTALSELGTYYVGEGAYTRAVGYFRAAIGAAAQVRNRNDGELAVIHSNLALAEYFLGDFAAADRSYLDAERIGKVTYGLDAPYLWVTIAQHARMLHLSGDRSRALALFEQVLPHLPPATQVNHDAAIVRENYGACLTAEGRARVAIPYLEAAIAVYQTRPLFAYEALRARAYLGAAYHDAGRDQDARRTLSSVLDTRARENSPDFQALLASREAWGRFLLDRNEIVAAAAQFREVVSQDHGRRLSHTALAYADLARVARRQGRLQEAELNARRAVDLYGEVQGWRDVRMGPYIWRTYARVLEALGSPAAARTWALRALDADRRFDDPSSPDIALDQDALRLSGSAPTR
ncbi:MAG: protein kinase [Gammaproteobacteria bacterium]|nr:protein kinase [Gammaproteobacteria bacterium]